MSTRTTTKSCPYNGCGYASTSTSASACDHNVGSHVSNLHGEKTKVWWGATQITILRDMATKEMVCPCGKFCSKNASLVRKHASVQHKGSGKITTAATSSVQQSGRALPSTPAVFSATTPRAPTERQSASKREASSAPMLRRSTSSRSVLDAVVIPPHLAMKKSSMASPSAVPVKRARVSFSTDPPKDTLPAKIRRKAEKEFSTTKAVKDLDSTIPHVTAQLSGTSNGPTGSSSKSRSPNKERPISAWRTEVSRHTKNSALSSIKKSVPLPKGPMAVHPAVIRAVIPTQVAQTSSPRADASAKRAPQQPIPQPSLSASPLTSSARKSMAAMEKEKRRKSKDQAEKFRVAQAFAADRQSPTTAPGSTSTFSVLPHADPPIPAPLRIPSPLHNPTVSSSSKLSPALHSSDYWHRTSTARTNMHATEPRRLVQSHTHSARTDNVQAAGAASSTTVSGSSVHVISDVPVRHAQPTPAMRPKPKPRPIPPPPKLPAAQSTAQNVNDVSKSGAVQHEKPADVPTTDQRGVKRPAESALHGRSAKWPALSSSSHHPAPPQPESDIDSDVPSQFSVSRPPEDGQKPRKRRRVTKQMRAREFRPWFDHFLKEYRAKKAAGDPSVVDRAEYEHVARLRAAGGTAYTTPEEFYAAVGERLRALRKARRHGDQKEVLEFHGGYAIVAQPKKPDSVRGEIVREELRDIGLSLDKDTAGRIEVSSGWGYGMSERWWHYPCTCGGRPKQSSHSQESSTGGKHSDWCHGRIVLKVGYDDALDAYRIGGQYISLEVVH